MIPEYSIYIILFAIYMVLMLPSRLKVRSIKKHDNVLYEFCAIRRSVMLYLRDNYETINKEEYCAIKQLLEVLNTTIHEYNEFKTSVFNVRWLKKRFHEEFIEKNRKLDELGLIIPRKKEILDLYDDFGTGMLVAFFAYTPLLKSELVINFSLWILKRLAKITQEKVGIYIESLSTAKDKMHEYSLAT